MRKIIILSVFLLLIGCTPKEVIKTEYVKSQVYDPPLPRPVELFTPKWYVLTKETIEYYPNGTVFVGLKWDDNIKYRGWLEDVKRYIGQSDEIIQHYREANQTIETE